jgi:catechol 2,3-dioxygenase-like lactoylglutathione lyase family enzyme
MVRKIRFQSAARQRSSSQTDVARVLRSGERLSTRDGSPHDIEAFRTRSRHMEKAVPVLPVDDLNRARDFYIDRLGFRVSWEWSDNGTEGLMGVERGGIELTLDCPMSGHGRDACVSLRVASADRYYNEWKSRGVVIDRPPKNEEWGSRTFGVQDPFGNTIFVIGPVV